MSVIKMFFQNRQRFYEKIASSTISLFYSGQRLFKSGDQIFPLEINKNFYYLTGIEQANSLLMLIKNNQITEEFLLLPIQSARQRLWDGVTLSITEIAQITQIPTANILNICDFESFLTQKIYQQNLTTYTGVYLDLCCSSSEVACNWALKQAQRLTYLFPFLAIHNSSGILSNLRQTKNQYEIQHIRGALAIQQQALVFMLKQLPQLQYEYQAAASYHYILAQNNTVPAFETIAAAGKNALTLHYQQNNQSLPVGELLLFDAGVRYHQYVSDITRCYPLAGTFNTIQKQIYNLVLTANKAIIQWVKPRHTWQELNSYGKNILARGLQQLGLLLPSEKIEKYCCHNCGHHLGLDVHDLLRNGSELIGENSIITIEPGLYLPKLNLGIRIEDNIVVTSAGNLNLSQNIPKEISEIEALMVD